MGDHFLAPGKGIPAVMPHSGKQGGIGQLKIFQKTICGDGVCQGDAV